MYSPAQVGNQKGSGDYLPPVDHTLVDYEEFAKVSVWVYADAMALQTSFRQK